MSSYYIKFPFMARSSSSYSIGLCCAVLCCAVLCCAVLCCDVLCCAVLCCAVLCCAVLCLCCVVLCCVVLCCVVLYCVVLCCVVPLIPTYGSILEGYLSIFLVYWGMLSKIGWER